MNDHADHQSHAQHQPPPADPHAGHEMHTVPTHHQAPPTHHEIKPAGSVKQTAHPTHVDHTGHEQMFQRRFWVCALLSIPVLLYSEMIQRWFGFSMPAFSGSEWIAPLFSILVFAYGGVPFLQMAAPEVRNRQPGMMTLISLAISVALVYSLAALFISTTDSFFWELVTLIDIMLLGHWLEMRSVRQASGALNGLAKLPPDTAERILEGGGTEDVSIGWLRVDDRVLVRPGGSIPADGLVEEGESDVNEAMITGESLPVKKSPGRRVIAGTINGSGSLRLRVTAVGDHTALAGIMRLVEQAQQSKSSTQILADKAAGWLFYIALAVAGLTAAVWIIAVGFSVEVVVRLATVLVIACPHALGLAIPLVVAITTSIGARNGILVRNRLALEQARLIDTVVFDKTGTLTRGEFGVVAMQTAPGWNEDQALALAAAIEGDSEHTIARGIRRAAEERGLSRTFQRQQDLFLVHRQGIDAHAHGVVNGVGDGWRDGDADDFANPFCAVRSLGGGMFYDKRDDLRRLDDRRDAVARHAVGEDPAILDDEMFRQCIAHTHHHAAFHLPLQAKRVQGAPDIIGRNDA
jgi:Cu2+-exporting ATPase